MTNESNKLFSYQAKRNAKMRKLTSLAPLFGKSEASKCKEKKGARIEDVEAAYTNQSDNGSREHI